MEKLDHIKMWGWKWRDVANRRKSKCSDPEPRANGVQKSAKWPECLACRETGCSAGRAETVLHVAYFRRLDHCGLTPTCCMVISQILVTSISLKSLSLAGNKVTSQGVKPLCDALIASQCTLQKLM